MGKKGAVAIAALFEDPQSKAAVSLTFAASIAKSIPGLRPDNVFIQKLYVIVERRLQLVEEGDVELRRLQESARLQVDYVIIIDALEVAKQGITLQSIVENLSTNVVTQLNTEITANAATLGLTDLADVAVLSVQDVFEPIPSTSTEFGPPPTRTTTATTTTRTTTTTSTTTGTTTTSTTSTTTSTTTTTIPLFIDDDLGPKAMAAAVNMAALFIGLCCCLTCVSLYAWSKCRRPKWGMANIGEIGGFQNYKAEWRYKKRSPPVSGQVEPTNGKDTVQWQIDVDVVAAQYRREFQEDYEEMSSHGGSRPSSARPSEAGSANGSEHTTPRSEGSQSDVNHVATRRTVNEQTAASQAFDVVTDALPEREAKSKWHLADDEDLLDDDEVENAPVVALYEDGATIEYYTRTHKRWIPGKVFTKKVPGTLLREPEVTYTVEVRTGTRAQLRSDVPIYLLRNASKDGDSVEVYSVKRGDRWVEAFVEGTPNSFGVSVVLEEDGTKLERVPTGRVRRRFLHGDQVEVYRGPARGFVSGEVDYDTARGSPQSMEFGMDAELDSGVGTVVSGMSVDTGGGSAHSDSGANLVGSAQECTWSMVPVRMEDEAYTQWVPSYFLTTQCLEDL